MKKTKTKDDELFLVVGAKHYDDIVAEVKNKEWRTITPYWTRRIYDRRPTVVRFQRGYQKVQSRYKIYRITLADKDYAEYRLTNFVPNGFNPVYFCIWIGDRLEG